MNKPSNIRMALMLGLISALGPLAVDMYLPALPAMTVSLQSTEGQMHQTLMAFFIGLACGQLLMGPLSDKMGRRTTFLLGMGIYAVGALGCMFTPDAQTLVFLRIFQGVGSAVGMSVGMAVVRDLYISVQAVRLMSLIILVIGIAPIVAPLLGSVIISRLNWQMIFAVLGVAAAIAWVGVWLFLPETTSKEQRQQFQFSRVLQTYATLVSSRLFIPFVLVAAFAQAGFFAYIAGSSFFFIELYGFEPMQFSMLFAVNAIGMMVAAQTSARLIGHFGAVNVVRAAGAIYVACCLVLLVLTWAQVNNIVLYCVMLFIAASMLPIIMPCCGMMAMASWGHVAGTASAMMGALQFGAGALATAMTGLFANGTAFPMFAAMSLCAILSLGFAMVFWPKHFEMPLPPGARATTGVGPKHPAS